MIGFPVRRLRLPDSAAAGIAGRDAAAANFGLMAPFKFRRNPKPDVHGRGVKVTHREHPIQMLVAKKSPWLQLMPGILALWLMPMVATSDSERIRMPEVVNQPWPALLAPDAELDPSIAVLQMRAAALARLLDAKAEEQAN